MSKRKNASTSRAVISGFMPEQSKQEKMISDMHSALYSLEDKLRKPMPRDGDKLLPKALRHQDSPETSAAKKYVETLHGHFEAAKKGD